MQTMKAARLHEIATPFRIDEVSVPDVGLNDVRVRVRGCGIVPNLKNVTHSYPEWFPYFPLPELPAVFGLDPTGEIEAVGANVVGLQPGQRVYVNPARGCDSCAACLSGSPVACEAFAFAGYFGSSEAARDVLRRYPHGGLAEYQVAPVSAIVPLDDAVSYDTASHFGYLGTSYAALRRGGAGPTTTVLVNGGTGTLGVGAAILALAMGVPKILAVARDRDRLERVRALNPDRILTHSTEDGPTRDWAYDVTGGHGADIVIEALSTEVPAEVTSSAYNSVRRGGQIVNIGGSNKPLDLFAVWFQVMQATVSGSVWFTSAQGRELSAMIASGTVDLSPFKYARFPLDKVNEAVETAYLHADGGFTNVLVTPSA